LCEQHDNENPSKLLRLVADHLGGKEPNNPGDFWYDSKILHAYEEACRRFYTKDNGWPTFAEFEKIFRDQNPRLQGASERSLRRSIRRLGFLLSPDKRGRPKGK
jgi:hypothetical protein